MTAAHLAPDGRSHDYSLGQEIAHAITHGAGVEAVMISGALAAEALVPGLLDAPAQVRAAAASAPAFSSAARRP